MTKLSLHILIIRVGILQSDVFNWIFVENCNFFLGSHEERKRNFKKDLFNVLVDDLSCLTESKRSTAHFDGKC